METLNQNCQTLFEIEQNYKTKVKNFERPEIKSSKDAYKLALSTWDYSKINPSSSSKVLFMNQVDKTLRIYEISSRGIAGTVVELQRNLKLCFLLCF
ncbi:hypothetical protein [Flavobacterium sp. 140616W15]|uniref:hypothetical protein n=1 Tax=Flavobacterium sp. 140616W15 TaxID=2478552 RepID=UPI000F0CD8C4|nr:hypothetical protein [Flavobacterium sp. 140616W15]AYN04050.1 hypothetical protein EAG11_07460 [Flavobacterium sp. 140616W15]